MKRMILGATALLLVVTPALAQAHTSLTSAVPANGTVINAWPSQLVLNFGEPLELVSGKEVNFVQVNNANAELLNNGPIQVTSNQIVVPVLPNTVQGPVLVNYRVAAADGHVVEGEYTFSLGLTDTTSNTPVTQSTVHAHGTTKNTAVYGATTVLIVLGLLFGLWAYRKRK
jgi:methionine-rich copper-binding protein CopC